LQQAFSMNDGSDDDLAPGVAPMCGRDRGELTGECWYRRIWRDQQLLDLVEVGLLRPRHRDAKLKIDWVETVRIAARQRLPYLDRPVGVLWMNGDSTLASQ